MPALAGLNIQVTGNSGPGNSYIPGDILTVTLTGDSGGLTSNIIRAVLRFQPSLTFLNGTPGQVQSSDPIDFWAQTAEVGTCGAGNLAPNQCTALDAFTYIHFGSESYLIDLMPSTLATFQFGTSAATGPLGFALEPDGGGFFGLPGVTLGQIPEPTTAARLGLGLAALGWARRQRPR